MDFKQERKRLNAIKNKNWKLYSEELRKPWPGMEEDVSLLLMILDQERQTIEENSLQAIEGFQILGDQVSTPMSNWLMSASEEFRSEFGHEEGLLRFEKALVAFFEGLF